MALATVGVGVGTGKITVDEVLKPGTIYSLPVFTVLNTGDETATYEVSIAYHEDQPELRPPENWFAFSPRSFELEPGQVQNVDVKLNLPFRTEPGEYFTYLEASPTKRNGAEGEASIGIAAASKLFFSVESANVLVGMYYRAISFWNVYAPWPQRALIVLVAAAAAILFKTYFNIEIDLKKPAKKSKKNSSSTHSSDAKKHASEDQDE